MGATVSIDTGGTFTDGYFTRDGQAARVKVDTTPHDLTEGLGRAVAEGAAALGYPSVPALLLDTDAFRFSSTIGTNSIIQRSGPRVGLLVSAGAAATLYGDGPSPLYDTFLRRDLVAEITDPLDGAEVRAAVRRLLVGGARVLVASLLGSDADPGGEEAIKHTVYAEYPRHYLGAVPCLIASEVTPRSGAERRTATAVINAYLYPDMVKALYKADEDLRRQGYPHPLLIVHASGGVARVAKTKAVETYSSGPVGGVFGSARMAAVYGLPAVVTMDIGGTSTDVSLILDGRVPFEAHPEVGRIGVHTPRVRVDAIGAGGGSIARPAPGDGGFTVGPESVGAVPGPAAYGLGGTQAAVVDAEVVLGHLDPAWFLGGRRKLDAGRARAALQRIAGDLAVEEAASAVHRALVEVAAAKVAAMTAGSGVPAAEVALFAFGGAGGLVAAEVAERAGLGAVYCFAASAVFSAFGIAGMDLAHTYETTPGEGLAERLAALAERAALDVAGEGFDPAALTYTVETDGDGAVVRLRAAVSIPIAPLVGQPAAGATGSLRGQREVWRSGGWITVPVHDRDQLGPGAAIGGPALVESVDTTIVVPEGTTLTVDDLGTAVLRTEGA